MALTSGATGGRNINSVLAAGRLTLATCGRQAFLEWAEDIVRGAADPTDQMHRWNSPEHVQHALRVLNRLLAHP